VESKAYHLRFGFKQQFTFGDTNVVGFSSWVYTEPDVSCKQLMRAYENVATHVRSDLFAVTAVSAELLLVAAAGKAVATAPQLSHPGVLSRLPEGLQALQTTAQQAALKSAIGVISTVVYEFEAGRYGADWSFAAVNEGSAAFKLSRSAATVGIGQLTDSTTQEEAANMIAQTVEVVLGVETTGDKGEQAFALAVEDSKGVKRKFSPTLGAITEGVDSRSGMILSVDPAEVVDLSEDTMRAASTAEAAAPVLSAPGVNDPSILGLIAQATAGMTGSITSALGVASTGANDMNEYLGLPKDALASMEAAQLAKWSATHAGLKATPDKPAVLNAAREVFDALGLPCESWDGSTISGTFKKALQVLYKVIQDSDLKETSMAKLFDTPPGGATFPRASIMFSTDKGAAANMLVSGLEKYFSDTTVSDDPALLLELMRLAAVLAFTAKQKRSVIRTTAGAVKPMIDAAIDALTNPSFIQNDWFER
ncbi:unnamed protein product, partial [Prorocentrum cordatum]